MGSKGDTGNTLGDGVRPETSGPRRFSFGPACYDERRQELRISGKVLEIDRKPLDVLLYLLNHPGQIISKDELAGACWPGRILSDSVLAKTLSRLREVLGNEGLIKTIHGRGYRLTASVTVDEAADDDSVPHKPLAEAERRQLTILFCDLVGSTALSERLDPEALRDIMMSYHAAATAVVERYEGYVAQVLGDGLYVMFGFPKAQDDDAERAVRCGCDILNALKGLRGDIRLSARIGIHTGTVVVGAMSGSQGRSETLAMGLTTNLAARLQSAAGPDSVLISAATLKLVPGLFITRTLPPMILKGIEKPVALYQVLQPSGVRSRLEAAEQLTPFVGRESEIALLQDRWDQTREGRGQVVLVTAEPGMGKSRLLLALHERLVTEPHTWLETRASPMMRNSAYRPIIELLQRGLAIRETDSDDTKLNRLELSLDAIGADRQDAVPLLAPLLDLNLGQKYPPSPYGPEMKRKRTMDLLNGWLVTLAQAQPLLLVFEDMHWADPSTLELMTRLMEDVPGQKIMVVMTGRPEFQPHWPVRTHVVILTLPPMRTLDAGRMLDSLIGHKPLPQLVQDRIVQRTAGVPLFVEEVTKQLLESGQVKEIDGKLELTGSIESLSIPETLQDSLMARLDRLGPAKDIAQIASVIGREIDYRLLLNVVEMDETQLQKHLVRLTQSGLLYQRGNPPDATYIFKHALIQDTAYNSLLKSTRQKLHRKIAEAIEAQFPERAKAEPAMVAEHFEKAGLAEPAMKYLMLAADSAEQKSSYAEALAHAEHALALVGSLAPSVQRDRYALEFTIKIGTYRSFTFGYGHSQTLMAKKHALDLCNSVRDSKLHFVSMVELWVTQMARAEHNVAIQLTNQMAPIVAQLNSSSVEAIVLGLKGWNHVLIGDSVGAVSLLGRALDLHNNASGSTHTSTIGGYDSIASVQVPLARAHWILGYPDKALRLSNDALVRCLKWNNPLMRAWAEGTGLLAILTWRRDAVEALAIALQSYQRAQKFGFIPWQIIIQRFIGHARGELGEADLGMPNLDGALAKSWHVDDYTTVGMSYCIGAEHLLRGKRVQESRAYLNSAFHLLDKCDEKFWEAETHRVNGKLLLAESNDETGAQASFERALEIARAQQAKSLELRAATSLARLWQKQGLHTKAYESLQAVYGWFTEGFETADLKDAKVLLDQLGT